jgi:subtilisin family serine protease
MKTAVLFVVFAAVCTNAALYHVRVRGHSRTAAEAVVDIHDTQVNQLSASDTLHLFLFNATSEAALRERLDSALSGARTRADTGAAAATVWISEVRDVRTRAVASWGLDRIGQRGLPLNNRYAPTATGSGATVWVVDTGLDATHTEFDGRAANVFAAYDPAEDCNGHGTHVAGTVGGVTFGVARAALLRGVKVLDCQGYGTTYTVASGLEYVLNNLGSAWRHVINLSLGYAGRDAVIESLIDDLTAAGVAVVAAAGNDNTNGCNHFPSAQPEVISVAASTISDARASFSNYGSCVDIFAPGVAITSSKLDGGSRQMSGTSMASPHVAGAAALLMGASSSPITPDTVRSMLYAAATENHISSVSGTPNRLLYVETTESEGSTSGSTSGSGSSSSSSSSGSGGSLTFGGTGSASGATTLVAVSSVAAFLAACAS